MTDADVCRETSPIVSIFQALRARHAKWVVEIGRPRGPYWIPGTALTTATEGPFQELICRIGERLHTSDRRTIAALCFTVRLVVQSRVCPIFALCLCARHCARQYLMQIQ
jgi:hypothetical protein